MKVEYCNLLIGIGKRISFFLFISTALWILGFFIFCFYFKTLQTPRDSIHTQALVVLTGDKNRISAAKKVFEQQIPKPLLHISGSNHECWHDFIHAYPFSARLISIDRSANTRENIILTKKWLIKNRIHSVRFLTSDYHIPRVMLWTQLLPSDVWILPHPVRSLPLNWNQFNQKTEYIMKIFKEYNKYLFTWAYFFYKKYERSLRLYLY